MLTQMMRYILCATILVLLFAVFQYVSLYQHIRVLRSQCDEEIQRG